MKTIVCLLCIYFCAVFVSAIPTPTTKYPEVTKKPHLLGSKECTWGPSYWCSNITAAKSCNAVGHCIQTVWEHTKLPEDNDSVCQICVKMVGEARDQLQSNETQEELKEVFEGSCKLIPLKIISKECCQLADQFIPELVETLASQMNPQVVCSVAGLCNNARIDKLLAEQESQKENEKTALAMNSVECDGCHTVVSHLQRRFNSMSRDEVLQGMLRVCGRMSSMSDGCTNIVITYFNDIYAHLQENLNPRDVCLMAGVCTAQFHSHIQVTPLSDMGKIDVATKDDLPCELCEQLVQHLRDLLIANTTEAEFQRVLEGLCAQTKGFKSECLSIVDEYYPEIYNFLVSELNANSVCVMAGICKAADDIWDDGPMWSMLPPATADKSLKIMAENKKLIGQDEVNRDKPKVQVIQESTYVPLQKPEDLQLPIERLMPHSLTLVGNSQLCTFCEYFLHFLQQQITSPATEEKIKSIVDGACKKLPRSISSECDEFVDTYGDAFIALLAQEIDPSQICPVLSLCPAATLPEVEILMHSKPEDKPNCPLCLFAVTELEDIIKNRKTEENIKAALSNLCKHLPKNLSPECDDFVSTYSDELVEMLVADLTPQEVCVYIKLCDGKSHKLKTSPPLMHQPTIKADDLTLTNEIPDDTVEGKATGATQGAVSPTFKDNSPQCVICEYVMSQLEQELKDKKNEDEVKKIVHNVCNHLPKSVAKECNGFVDKYADMIIQLLISTMEPDEICGVLNLCASKMVLIHEEILDCAICETTVTALDSLLDNPKVDHAMEHVLKKACLALPMQHQQKCKAMIDTYGDSFFQLVSKLSDSKGVCQTVGLCASDVSRPKVKRTEHLVGSEKCTYGPSYWCASMTKAQECRAVKHCQEKYWKGDNPK